MELNVISCSQSENRLKQESAGEHWCTQINRHLKPDRISVLKKYIIFKKTRVEN